MEIEIKLNEIMLKINTDRKKNAAQWFYQGLYRDETILPRQRQPREELPAPLQRLRAMQTDPAYILLPREQLFVLQGRELADYEDDFDYSRDVLCYYPTYQSLNDRELRAYFTWRARWRRGKQEKTWLSFAFLYIYELLNQIGVENPVDGFERLRAFQRDYGLLDKGIARYLRRWLEDYVVYYRLDPVLLAGSARFAADRRLALLREPAAAEDAALFEALGALSSYRLDRSVLVSREGALCETVFPRVYRSVAAYYDKHRTQSLADAWFGAVAERPAFLFDAAVFWDQKSRPDCEYVLSPLRRYLCRGGNWYLRAPESDERHSKKLGDLMRTVDSRLRAATGVGSAIQPGLSTKWILAIIDGEIANALRERQAAEARRVRFDYSRLAGIRADAAETREKLIVDEEREEAPPAPEPEDDGGLTEDEKRLLRCLLAGEGLAWLREKGLLPSVLTDAINEKLYERFGDTVLLDGEPPALVEDYAEELKDLL